MITRRTFLKNAAAGVGTAALGVPAFAQAGSPNEKLDLAIIGSGGQGLTNLRYVQSENIAVLCDVNQENLDKCAARFPKARLHRDYRKMLEKEKVDAVVISIPDHSHAPASLMAMRMGFHCYTEKPLAHTIEEVRLMAKVAADNKLATQMGNGGHGSNGIREVVEIVRAGVIGDVTEVHAWTDRPGAYWQQGLQRPKDTPDAPKYLDWDLWLGPAPVRPYHPVYTPSRWRGWWDFGTGPLGDIAPHCLDPAFWALDLGHPEGAWAEGEPHLPECGPLWSRVHLDFPARGKMPPVAITWYDGNIPKGRDSVRNQPSNELVEGFNITEIATGSIFVGTKGNMLLMNAYGSRQALYPRDKFADWERPEPTLPRSIGHHAEWIKACKEGGTGLSNFDYASRQTEVALVGVIAFRLDRKIEWDGPNMKAKNCPEADRLIRKEYRTGWTL